MNSIAGLITFQERQPAFIHITLEEPGDQGLPDPAPCTSALGAPFLGSQALTVQVLRHPCALFPLIPQPYLYSAHELEVTRQR